MNFVKRYELPKDGALYKYSLSLLLLALALLALLLFAEGTLISVPITWELVGGRWKTCASESEPPTWRMQRNSAKAVSNNSHCHQLLWDRYFAQSVLLNKSSFCLIRKTER